MANDEKVEETKEDAGDEVKEEVYQALSGPEEHVYHWLNHQPSSVLPHGVMNSSLLLEDPQHVLRNF